MTGMAREAVFITQWKDEMKQRIQLRFKDRPLSEKKINKYLDKVIEENMVNPQVQVVNNYRDQVVQTDLLSLIDTITDNQLIIGGGAVLYVQHDTPGRENVMYSYIVNLQNLRNSYKGERKKYEKNSEDWVRYDILQNNTKIKVNSLYGVHGYDGFIVYNRFIAEAITNCGRQIITTAVMTFENFLNGNVKLNTEEELYQFITNVCRDYNEDMDFSIFQIENIDHEVVKKLIKMCAFDVEDELVITLTGMVKNLDFGVKVLLYYKNNLLEFTRLPFIMKKLRYVISHLNELKAPNRSLIKDDSVLAMIDDIWDFYHVFVVYDHPMYDRVRKAMYTDRTNVLYVDTDSNFLGLNEWVSFVKHDVCNDTYIQPERELDFIAVNLMAMFLSKVIDLGLQTLAKYMNVKKEYAKALNMKNEFYLDRILFTSAKKRYISNTVLQEGDLLNGGKGLPDIKGFDFKKSVTKPYIRDYYIQICEEDILRSKSINVIKIYEKILSLKKEIDLSMENGENTFFKQANVQKVEHYVNPYSTQGIVAILLWNTLCPEYAMELPTDCDIIPIKELSGPRISSAGREAWSNKKFVMEFADKYPSAYEKLEREIYQNPNELIQHMGLTSIAKPKNKDVPLPEWFSFLIDTNKVSLDALELFSPILKSLGLNELKTNASTSYMTNIIDL